MEPQVSEAVEVQQKPKSLKVWLLVIVLIAVLAFASIASLINAVKGSPRPKPVVAQSIEQTPVPAPNHAATVVDFHRQIEQDKQASETQMPTNGLANGQNGQAQNANGQQQQQIDPVAEMKRRREMALALSPGGWQKGQESGASATTTKDSTDAVLDDTLKQLQAMSRPGVQPVSIAQAVSANPSAALSPAKSSIDVTYAVADPELPKGWYLIKKGRFVEALTDNKLEGEFSGPVRCHTTTDMYDEDGQHLLVPAGSILVGEASAVGETYQRRLAVLFTDLLLPHSSVDLGKATGLDQEGATALRDQVNRHIPSTIAMVGAIGVLGGLAQSQGGSYNNSSGTQRIYSGIGTEAGEMGMGILGQQLRRPPEITIRPGDRVRVWINKPIALPEFRVAVKN
jgi:type IV secretory pathway VirB10-like protein